MSRKNPSDGNRKKSPASSRSRRAYRLGQARRPIVPIAELLEDRVLLAGGSPPLVLEITSLADSGPGTLRALLVEANGASADITFAPGLSGTIYLNTPLVINNETIFLTGPGPHSGSISNTNDTGIFDIQGTGVLDTLSELTLIDSNISNIPNTPGAITAEVATGLRNRTLNLSNDVFETVGAPNNVNDVHDTINVKSGSKYNSISISNSTFLGNYQQNGQALTSRALEETGAALNVFSSTFENFSSALKIDAGTTFTVNVGNSTFIGNYSNGEGAAINADPAVPLGITACTFTENQAVGSTIDAGSLGNPAFLNDSIVYGNLSTNLSSLTGNFLSLGYNDIQNDTNLSTHATFQGGFKSTDLHGVDPLFAGLGDFGGSTPTIALEPGSPVLTAGNPNASNVDQRGYPRSSTVPSIGAYAGTGVLFTVKSTDDNGGIDPAPDNHYGNITGTLRQAIVDANSFAAGTFAIQFAVNGGGPQAISVQNKLDTITVPVVIDGSTQPGYVGSPIVTLVSASALNANIGLELHSTSGQSEILGLQFSEFANNAIRVESSQPLLIAGNIIGASENTVFAFNPFANGVGVYLSGASHVTIGGTLEDDRNIISGNNIVAYNGSDGVYIDSGSSANLVEGNYFGTTADGFHVYLTFNQAVDINVQGNLNTIGGSNAGAGNVIGGATTVGSGALVVTGNTNFVVDNNIGVAIDGITPLPNLYGIIASGLGNQIGVGKGGNLIENSTDFGIIFDPGGPTGVSDNMAQGNFIQHNAGIGLLVFNTAVIIGGTNTGDGNTFAGNASGGLQIAAGNAFGNIVEGNSFGFDSLGVEAGNGPFAIDLQSGTSDNFIGEAISGGGNTISALTVGLTQVGIRLDNTSINMIAGNVISSASTGVYLTINATGNKLDSNSISTNGQGVLIDSGSTGNGIRSGNTISGNAGDGILIQGNDNFIGGGVGAGNYIFGNGSLAASGNIQLDGPGAIGNSIGDNIVGYDPITFSGSAGFGIEVSARASSNSIFANVVSSNNGGPGILLTGEATNSNIVNNNFVGTDKTGNSQLANKIGIELSFGASLNVIDNNIISGNTNQGVYLHGNDPNTGTDGNYFNGDYIGTDAAGTATLQNGKSNAAGLEIDGVSYNNTFQSCVISGNLAVNVQIGSTPLPDNNFIGSSMIGTDYTGEFAISPAVPNGPSVDGIILDGARGAVFSGDVISGNSGDGISLMLGASLNQIQDNMIGVDHLGTTSIPNGVDGIQLDGSSAKNTIGGSITLSNVISGNTRDGVELDGADITTGLTNNFTGNGTLLDSVTSQSATVINNISYAPGHAPGTQAFSFDGVSSGLDLGSQNFGATDFTISLWVKTSVKNTDQVLLGAAGNFSDLTYSISIGISGNTAYASLRSDDGQPMQPIEGTAVGTTDITDGAYHNVVVSRSTGLLSIYVDGALENQAPNKANLVGLPTGLGGFEFTVLNVIGPPISTFGNEFSGQIDDIEFFDRALARVDVASLANPNGQGFNSVSGNYIGTNSTGLGALPNVVAGVVLFGAVNNTIGGSTAGSGNVISGNNVTGGIGVEITGAAYHNQILSDLIGVGEDGNTPLGNFEGILINEGSHENTIGGSVDGGPTVISGSTIGGVYISDPNTSFNIIEDARIGTNAAGTMMVGNGDSGVKIQASASNNTISGGADVNSLVIISGNGGDGVDISNSSTSGNAVTGAIIGLASDGKTVLANAGAGIVVQDFATGLILGNTISGNDGYGIALFSAAPYAVSISGNRIGTSVDGKISLGNTDYGVLILATPGSTIGGSGAGAGNTISGTTASGPTLGFGIEVATGSVGTVIQGNVIGGLPGFANTASGIHDASDFITIGGSGTNAGNLIENNGGAGILLGAQAAKGSSVSRNTIAGNLGVGIAIDFSGIDFYPHPQNYLTTPVLNIHGGQLNAPVITSATILSGFLTVTGYSRKGSIIEFDGAQPDATGFGQGVLYLGTFTQGSADDYDNASGPVSYSSPIYGSDTSAYPFKFTFAVGTSFTPGMVLTSLSEGTASGPSISEFGTNDTAVAGVVTVGPILFAGANATVLVGQTYSYRGIFGDNSSASVTATVDYGDGSGPMPLTIDPINAIKPTIDSYALSATGYFELSHIFSVANTPANPYYTVLVTLSDSSGLVSKTSLRITVVPAPPKIDNTGIHLAPVSNLSNTSSPAVVSVDQPVRLSGTFTDPNPLDTHTVEVLWGDGSHSFATVNEANQSFSTDHSYNLPSSDVGAQGLYPVLVTITNNDGLSSTTTGGLFYAEVIDAPPSHVALMTDQSTITAGGSVTLSGSFLAPHDTVDLYHVVIDWGDGLPTTAFDLIGGTTSFSGIVHPYKAQPVYQAGTKYTITVWVSDPFEPITPATGSISVLVNPPTTSALTIATNLSTIYEGGQVTLSGLLNAAIPSDTHDLTIEWGDGTSTEVPLTAGQLTFGGINQPLFNHSYAFNSVNQPGGTYQITAMATDPSRTDLAPASTLTPLLITVLDVAPSVSGLVLTDIRGNVLTQTLENTTVVVTGKYTNPGGVLENDTVMIDWGDGSSSPAAVDSNLLTFTASHDFGTTPGKVLSFLDTITATATDSEGLAGSTPITLTLVHASPVVAIHSGGYFGGSNQPILMAPIGSDTGTVVYTWTINGTPDNFIKSGSYTLPTSLMVANADVSVMVSVMAMDSYGASSTYTSRVDLVDDVNSIYQVVAPTTAVNAILVDDLAGGKTIVSGTPVFHKGSLLMSNGLPVVSDLLTTPVDFDGIGAETFIGGNTNANPTFHLHSDGAKAYRLGGDADFVLTPNCTLDAVAGGGHNTLDFSSSTFGVSFNLGLADGTHQDVDPAAPLEHFVGINDLGVAGTFSTLIGSSNHLSNNQGIPFGDNITATDGSTIIGGSGMDTVNLNSASGVTVNASNAGNQIIAMGNGLSNFTYNGDANANAKGDVSFLNMGSSSGVNFYGDRGSTTFNNGPGALATGTIAFSGDRGTTTLNNGTGAVSMAAISFSGDRGSSVLNNGAGATLAGMISFSGDQGSATFNNGPVAIAFSFSGDHGSATFGSGPATTSATISFAGDRGSTTFNNGPGGTVASTITFSGDQGTAIFNNGISSASPFSFAGDRGSATLANGTVMGMISFEGDQGSATFNNAPGAIQAFPISFSGDHGSATFNNGSPVGSTTISFSGDHGTAIFNNSATVSMGTISFTGDGGSAIFNNGPGATQVGTISFSGDKSSNIFNNGAVAIAISYAGDLGSTIFASGMATASGIISFSGDRGTTTFNNGPGGTVAGTITFSGDLNSVTFNNGVVSASPISFSGDRGSATLANGTVMGMISFAGDHGSATFNNGPGAIQVGTVSFSGDHGTAIFNNGSPVGSTTISFSGDHGTATFANSGTVSMGTISFAGDGGTATFNNLLGATQSGAMSFSGDQSTNIFNNAPGSFQTGTISFGGDQNTVVLGQAVHISDQSSHTFNNFSGATQSGTISFVGDRASNTLNNASGAMQSGQISYAGDRSSNTFISAATTSGPISYAGDGNTELYWNQGSFATGLAFAGSTLAVSTTLVNTGTFNGDVTFTGNAGTDAFFNGAIVNNILVAGTITGDVHFISGPGSGTFVNDGSVQGSIFFSDKAFSDSSTEALVNYATVAGSINYYGGAGADSLKNYGPVGKGLAYVAGSGTNLLINGTLGAVGSISFMGSTISHRLPVDDGADPTAPPTLVNELLNQADGLVSVTFMGGSGGNLLVNTGKDISLIEFHAFGTDNVLENYGSDFVSILFYGSAGVSTLINEGGSTPALGSTITYTPEADTNLANDTLENSGAGLASIKMTASLGTDRLVNIGDHINTITFYGGALGGTLLSSGSYVGWILDYAGGGSQFVRNDGMGIGKLDFEGSAVNYGAPETNYFLNNGSTSALTFVGGLGNNIVINAGSLTSLIDKVSSVVKLNNGSSLSFYNAPNAMVSGLTFSGNSGAFLFENAGTVINSSIDASLSASGQFTNDRGATATNVTYASSRTGDHAFNYGSFSGFTFYGGAGPGELDLYGPQNQGILYNGGTAGDTLVIGTNAGNVSGITFIGNDGPDLLASDASHISNVHFTAGLGTATLWNLGAYASGLTLKGGSNSATFDNTGDFATGLSIQGGSGSASFDNTGNHFGVISFIGGSGANTLTNEGDGATGSSITFTGGLGDNSLTNSGKNVGMITLQDGPQLNAIDNLVNSGDDVISIVLATNAGVTSLINTGSGIGSINDTSNGGSPTLNNSGQVDSLMFLAGSGDASLVDSGDSGPKAVITFVGGGPDDTFVDSATAGSTSFDAGGGGSQVVIKSGATGLITLIEGSGGNNDTMFSGSPQAYVTIKPPSTRGLGVSTLDFSNYLGGGLVLDLMSINVPQFIAGGLTLKLTDPAEITHVVGTQYTNTVYGNLLSDTLDSAALPDPTTQSNNTIPAIPNATTQWAYLDFGTYNDPIAGLPVHVYSAAERQTIAQTIEADYVGPDPSHPWFNIEIMTNPADIPIGVAYATLYFNRTPSTGQPGGEANEVDFGNLDSGGSASIQVNGLLGGAGQPTNTTANFDTLSAKIGAHEFAHLLGVRHSDAFGPIGFGIHTPPGSSQFNPSDSGPTAAFETFDHIISSPATEGTDRFNDLKPLDFGPREAIKIAFGEQGTITPATTESHSTVGTAMSFPLDPLAVPNTDVTLPEIEQGMNLQVVAGAISGKIVTDQTTGLAAPDYYKFTGKKGDDFTFETESQQLPALAKGGSVDTVISVYDSLGNLVPYYGGFATNDDQFEGSDSLLDDVILPADGTYYVKVTSFAARPGDPRFDPSNPKSPLYVGDTTSILNPANPNYDAAARLAYIEAGNGTATGKYDLFIYRESQANPTAQNVNNILVARGGGSTLASTGQADILVGGPGTDTYTVGSDTITLTSSPAAPAVDLQTASLFNLTINDTALQPNWAVTINYGDGSAMGTAQAKGGQSLAISHLYSAPGNYQVTISYLVGQHSQVQMNVPVNIIETQAPTAQITAIPSSSIGINTSANFTATIQNPYVGTDFTATWTFTNLLTGHSFDVTPTTPINTSTAVVSLPFTLPQSFGVAGTYAVQLIVTNNFNNQSSTATFAPGTPTTFTVLSQFKTSASLTAPTITYGADGTITVTESSTGGTPTGTVLLSIDGGSALSQSLSGGSAVFTLTLPGAGDHTLSETYAAQGNFLSSNASGVLHVNKAHLTVSADSKSKTYDGLAYAQFSATLSGFVASDKSTVVSGSPSFSGLAVTAVNAGSYTISPAQGTLTASNYDFTTFNSSTLAISKAHLTVTATVNTSDIGHGDPVPTPSASFSGFVHNENASVVTGTAGFTGLPTTTSPAGIYPVTPTTAGLSSTNYDFPTVVTTKINVHPKITDILVKWGSKTLSILNLSRDLPFFNINGLEVKFSDPVNVNSNGLALTSLVKNPAYAPVKVGTGLATNDVSWNLPSAIGIDILMMSLDQANIASTAASSLTLFGLTTKSFSVLPGDFNGDGVVNAADFGGVNSAIALPYNVFADMNGDGTINTADVLLVRSKVGTKLPPLP